MISIYNYLYQ